jgi:hypothetical protein
MGITTWLLKIGLAGYLTRLAAGGDRQSRVSERPRDIHFLGGAHHEMLAPLGLVSTRTQSGSQTKAHRLPPIYHPFPSTHHKHFHYTTQTRRLSVLFILSSDFKEDRRTSSRPASTRASLEAVILHRDSG